MDAFQVFVAIVPFLLLLALPELQFTASNKPTTFSLELIHRDSPESPLYPGNLTFHERVQRYIKTSESRASYLMSIATHNNTIHPDLMRPYVVNDYLLYFVRVSIGTPRRNFLLFLDTGSGLSWVRCKPCKNCYFQNSSIYNPLSSSSYRKLSCDNIICMSSFACTNGECLYDVHYVDGSSSKGVASWESVSFMSPNKRWTIIRGMLFGCSDPNQKDEQINGLMGLDMSPYSMISQMATFIKRRFSYCLVPPSPDGNTPMSYLKFGTDMGFRGGAVQSTPFVMHPKTHWYGLNLLDISINGKRLNYRPNTFKVKRNGQGGLVIDSGATLSFFDERPYWKLHNEFVNYFSGFQLKEHSCNGPMKLCYTFPADFNSFPSMTYHFQDANLTIAPEHVFIINRKDMFFRLGIAPFPGENILGAWQQHNTRFTYDLKMKLLSFVPENCSEDTG